MSIFHIDTNQAIDKWKVTQEAFIIDCSMPPSESPDADIMVEEHGGPEPHDACIEVD